MAEELAFEQRLGERAAVDRQTGENIEAALMAIRFRIPVKEIAAMLHPYLTQAEGIKLLDRPISGFTITGSSYP